jgi:hypothetical protein
MAHGDIERVEFATRNAAPLVARTAARCCSRFVAALRALHRRPNQAATSPMPDANDVGYNCGCDDLTG